MRLSCHPQDGRVTVISTTAANSKVAVRAPHLVPPHANLNTAIAPIIMAELRVGSVTLAATDESWKTHMSQVRALPRKSALDANEMHQIAASINNSLTSYRKPTLPCMLRTSALGKMVLSGVTLSTIIWLWMGGTG
jgi:hypothetical protein